MALPWAESEAPYGALGAAEIRAGFLKNPERLIHGISGANRPENLEMGYDLCGKQKGPEYPANAEAPAPVTFP